MFSFVRPRVAASLVLAALVLPLPGVLAAGPAEPSIVGGTAARPGEYPFVVSLQRVAAAGAPSHFCGGSLVSDTEVPDNEKELVAHVGVVGRRSFARQPRH